MTEPIADDVYHLNPDNLEQVKDFVKYCLNMPMIKPWVKKGNSEKVECGIEYLRYVLKAYCVGLRYELDERKQNDNV